MSVSNIVLADALATPVNHTFIPMGLNSAGEYVFVDQSQSNEIGYFQITVKIEIPAAARPGQSSSGRVRKVTIGLHEPIMEALSNNSAGFTPAPTIAYIERAMTTYYLPERGSLLDRKNLRKMNYLLQNDANIISVIENGTRLP